MSKIKIEEIDTEVWYELYDGNGGRFDERFEFVKNSKRVLKGLRNGAKIKSVFDDTKYSELDTKKQDEYIATMMKNPVFEIGNYAKTTQVLTKTNNGNIYEARLKRYEDIDHSIAIELANDDPETMIKMELQNILTDELFLKKKSPHFLAMMGNANAGAFETWRDDMADELPEEMGTAMVFEKFHGTLLEYMEKDEDFEDSFFYFNTLMQSLIALAQFHKTTGMVLNGVGYKNYAYIYSSQFEGLDDNNVEEYLWNEYDNYNEKIFVPATNMVIILYNFDSAQTRADGKKGLEQLIKDYESLFNLFIRVKDGGMLDDNAVKNNKKSSKFLSQFIVKAKEALIRGFSDKKFTNIENTPNYFVSQLCKYSGKPSIDNAVICSKETYGSDIINDIAYVI
jgi:hypothetical protein